MSRNRTKGSVVWPVASQRHSVLDTVSLLHDSQRHADFQAAGEIAVLSTTEAALPQYVSLPIYVLYIRADPILFAEHRMPFRLL